MNNTYYNQNNQNMYQGGNSMNPMYPNQNQFNGYNYGPQPVNQQPTPVQFLSQDEMKEIKQKSPMSFKTKLTRDEYLRSICTHKDPRGRMCLENMGNGMQRCKICGKQFHMIDYDEDPRVVEAILNNFSDLLETIKSYLWNAPADIKNLYMFSGYIPNLMTLWNIASTNFKKVTSNAAYNLNPENSDNAFAWYYNIFGNGLGNPNPNPYFQQQAYPNTFVGAPNYAYPGAPMNGGYQQPPYQQQNMMNPQQQYQPQAPMYNGGYQQPQQQAPQAPNNYVYANNQPQQQAPQQNVGMNQNPIGYVDNTRDFTSTIPQNHQQPQGNGQTQINIAGPSVNSGTQPAPQAPVNPNVQAPQQQQSTPTFKG